MAQFRFSLSIASRKQGRSAVAMAAYRAGEEIRDERTGEKFNFTHKGGIVHTDMVLPKEAPDWAGDRAQFWNRSEAADKRADAQIAREIQLSLPHELNDRQRHELTKGFAGEVAARFGVAVDTCIHAPHHAGDERNHHAHLLLGTRSFNADKATGFGNKIRALDNIAQKRGGPDQTNEVEALRALWAQRLNEALERAEVRTEQGEAVQVDHRSYQRQGSEQEPTVKEGVAATGLKRRGQSSERATLNDEIRARNAERDRLKASLGAAAREVAELKAQEQKQSIQGRDAEPPQSTVSAHIMTEAELQKAARVDEFRARFDAYIEQCRANDAAQTGRTYEHSFDTQRDLDEQWNEKIQPIDNDFDDDDDALRPKFHEDRSDFEDWLEAERDRMRAEDATRNPQKVEPRPVPTFGQIPGAAQARLAGQGDPLLNARENVRRAAEEDMRKEFEAFQAQRLEDRPQCLNDQHARNLDQLEVVYKQTVERQNMEKTLSMPRQASQRTNGELPREFEKPKEPTSFKIMKGESEEQARARHERMEAARIKREEDVKKDDGRKPPKDDWTR